MSNIATAVKIGVDSTELKKANDESQRLVSSNTSLSDLASGINLKYAAIAASAAIVVNRMNSIEASVREASASAYDFEAAIADVDRVPLMLAAEAIADYDDAITENANSRAAVLVDEASMWMDIKLSIDDAYTAAFNAYAEFKESLSGGSAAMKLDAEELAKQIGNIDEQIEAVKANNKDGFFYNLFGGSEARIKSLEQSRESLTESHEEALEKEAKASDVERAAELKKQAAFDRERLASLGRFMDRAERQGLIATIKRAEIEAQLILDKDDELLQHRLELEEKRAKSAAELDAKNKADQEEADKKEQEREQERINKEIQQEEDRQKRDKERIDGDIKRREIALLDGLEQIEANYDHQNELYKKMLDEREIDEEQYQQYLDIIDAERFQKIENFNAQKAELERRAAETAARQAQAELDELAKKHEETIKSMQSATSSVLGAIDSDLQDVFFAFDDVIKLLQELELLSSAGGIFGMFSGAGGLFSGSASPAGPSAYNGAAIGALTVNVTGGDNPMATQQSVESGVRMAMSQNIQTEISRQQRHGGALVSQVTI